MKWYTTWSYLPINYNTTIGTVENITQRTFFWNNLDGTKVRVKFSNSYGQEPLVLEKVLIGQRKKNEKLITAVTTLTHKGKGRIEIAPGKEIFSDEVIWEIEAGTEIVLSVYIKQRTNVQCACSTWSARSWYTVYGENGDYTEQADFAGKESREVYPYIEEDVNKANVIVGVSAIQVYSEEDVKTVALFGDSITHMSYYADALMERVYSVYPGKVAIVNRGIGGNRILRDATFVKDMPGEGKCFGTAAIMRFERDVYGTEQPEYVLMLEGVNDMMHPEFFGRMEEYASAEQLAAGVESIAETAHCHGSKFYLGTVMPFGNDEMPGCPMGEKVRGEFNEWIRTQTIADGLIDFEKAIQKADAPAYMRDGLHIGDGLHPNAEGGAVMAEIVLAGRK